MHTNICLNLTKQLTLHQVIGFPIFTEKRDEILADKNLSAFKDPFNYLPWSVLYMYIKHISLNAIDTNMQHRNVEVKLY